MKSPKLQKAVEYLSDKKPGTSVRVAWKASKDYALGSQEHRAAIAVNACDVIKGEVDKATGDYEIRIRCAMVYPKYSWTEFNLGKFSIFLHEGPIWLRKGSAIDKVDMPFTFPDGIH